MQPYFFPYIGYFQLLAAVDRFVVYDDVTYIKGGWINRNRWLVGGSPAYFTVPVQGASSYRTIAETRVAEGGWPSKLLTTFRQSYSHAPFRDVALALLERVVSSHDPGVGRLAAASVRAVAAYLDIATPITDTSAVYGNSALRSNVRVLDICRIEHATIYINAIGGIELYDRDHFSVAGIELKFLRPRLTCYPQFAESFIPGLSVLDVIAFNPPDAIREMLKEYELA